MTYSCKNCLTTNYKIRKYAAYKVLWMAIWSLRKA
jgi:hypothetical protein